jgi:MoxR-like ATPase
MQERQVSVGGLVHELPNPFFVLATQNPLDQEGTYMLPEAQQDRFLFKILVGYPSPLEEQAIVRMVTSPSGEVIQPILQAEDVLEIQQTIRTMPVADVVVEYATNLVRSTRNLETHAPDLVRQWVAWGCGPRASISLVTAARAAAALRGATCVACEDVARVAKPVLRHRIGMNYAARAEGITPDFLVDELITRLPAYQPAS